jgi:phosphoglycolate phosphatase
MMSQGLLIFDLDGTLIDSAPDIRRAVDAMLADLKAAPLPFATVRGMIGDGARQLVSRVLSASGIVTDEDSALRSYLAHYKAAPVVETRPYPGVPETLAALLGSGYRLAVATNKPEALARQVLDELGLADRFEQIVGGDTNPYRKPDPRILTGLIAALAANSTEAIMIGDSEVDAETAAAAGLPFVLMTCGYHRGSLSAMPHALQLDTFNALPAALNSLTAAYPHAYIPRSRQGQGV